MVGYREARELARKRWSEVDYATEYPDAYAFSKKNDFSFGGNGPVVVLKEDGSCVNFLYFLEESGLDCTPVGECFISEREE